MIQPLQDVRHAFRRVLREPGVSLPSVLMLGLAIAAGVTIFAAVERVLLDPLPYAHPDRLVFLWHRTDAGGAQRFRIPAPDVTELRRSSRTLRGVAFTNDVFDAVLVGTGRRPAHVTVGRVTPDFFSVLGVAPRLGRGFRPGEAVLSRAELQDTAFVPPPSVVVLGYRLWRDRFGADPGVLGTTVRLNGSAFTVVGVAPRGFELLMPPDVGLADDVDAWTPLRVPPALFRREGARPWQDQDSDNTGAVIARLAPGATLSDVRAEMRVIAARERRDVPSYGKQGVEIDPVPMREDIVAPVRPALLVLFGAVVLVLLIAAFNVAGLLLARNLDRVGELRLRAALGADRVDLLREELGHSLVLAALGAALGVGLAAAAMRILPALAPAGIPRLSGLHLDARVLGFASATVVVAAAASGLLPTLAASRSRRGGTGPGSSRRLTRGPGRSAAALVSTQVALSIVLLVGAGLFLRGFVRMQQLRPGFEPRGLATFRLSLPPARFGGPADRARFVSRLADRIGALPGVRAVGVTGGLPLGGRLWTRPYGPGGSSPASWTARKANFRVISSGYFRALGTTLLAGRSFSRTEDVVEADRVAIIDAGLARRLSPDGTAGGAIGRRLGFPLDGEAVEAEVVGVVAPVRYESLRGPVRPTIYVPYRQEASRDLGVAVRTDGTAADLRSGVDRALRALNAASDVPVFDFRPMRQTMADAMAATRFALVLIALFALVALLLAAIGVHSTVAYGVRRRRREIGVRMAVGASPRRILRQVTLSGLAPVVVGMAVGLGLASAVSLWLADRLVDVSPVDPLTLVLVAAGTLVVGALAALQPARSASRVEPSAVLRSE